MGISVLVLAAGPVESESPDREYPTCLTEFSGFSLLEKIVRNTAGIKAAKYAFAFLSQETDRFHLDKIAKLLVPSADIFRIPGSTQGSACTALLSACQLDPDSELLIVSANELVEADFSELVDDFRCRQLVGGLLTFRSIHPRYSFIRMSADLVIEAAQQDPISDNATAGVFWFAKTADFIAAAMDTIRKNASVGGKFYVAPVFNELILKGARVGVRDLDPTKYIPLKNRHQLQKFANGPKQ